jgi:hypothetical protein
METSVKEPRIIAESTVGMHNDDLDQAIQQVEKSKMYEDLSTIIICPTRGMFPTRVVQSWMRMLKPMNQVVAGPIFAESMKVDDAYNALISYILKNPYLSKFKYVLTIEEDNLPPADGLLKLYESMDKYDVVGGLYWSKTEDNSFPMLFGDPSSDTFDSKPLVPKPGEVQPAQALGMGFNLFKLDMFRQLEEPWFKTVQESDPLYGVSNLTQDFYFYRKAYEKGFKFACDNRVLVGHLDSKKDIVY